MARQLTTSECLDRVSDLWKVPAGEVDVTSFEGRTDALVHPGKRQTDTCPVGTCDDQTESVCTGGVDLISATDVEHDRARGSVLREGVEPGL
jgi:hypothetical protein